MHSSCGRLMRLEIIFLFCLFYTEIHTSFTCLCGSVSVCVCVCVQARSLGGFGGCGRTPLFLGPKKKSMAAACSGAIAPAPP